MLELIFRGGLEWGYGLILECWEYFSVILMDIMSMDFAYLREHMPVLNSIQQIVLTIGWAILLGNLVFQAAKTMLTGLGFEGEDPKLLFVRTFIFAFLLLASPQICELCLNMTSKMIDLMQVPDAVDITFADEASFGGMAAAWLLVIICGIIVMFQSFKLIFEMAERYFILAVLTILAPVAFGVGGSRNTSDIFAGWCRMYGSMCLLMILNVMFIKMLLSVLSFYPSGVDVLPWMVLVLTIVKVAKKIDGIITRIGLNPAITGDPLGRTFPGALTCLVMKTAAAQVSKTIGKAAGGSSRGRPPHTPPGSPRGPRSGGSGGGRWAHFSKTAGSAYTYTSTHSAQQSAAAQTQTHQKPPPGDSPQGVTAHTAASASSPPDSVPSEGAAGPNGRNGLPGQDVHTKQESRKSAVPSGARRAPSHVKAAAGGAAASAAAAVVSGKAGRGSRGGPDGTVPGRPGSSSAGTPEAASPAGASRSTRIPLHDSPCGPAGIRNQGAGPAHASGDHGREQKCAPQGGKIPRTETPRSSLGASPRSASDMDHTDTRSRSTRRPPESADKGTRPVSGAASPGTAGTVHAQVPEHTRVEAAQHAGNGAPPTAHPTHSDPARQESRPASAADAPSGRRSTLTSGSGIAGTAEASGSERSHVRPSRPAGHGTPPSAAVSSAGAGRPGQARQETHRPTHATAPELRDAGPLHGTAGTAPAEPKAAHTRTAAQGPSKRAATPPAAQDIREPRRIAPGAAAPMKGQETRKRAPRPKQGGADHG